jgi:hypothetical protein
MTRRRLFLLALPVALVLLGVGTFVLWPRTAITRENAERIQVGMTLAEVEEMLGGPARDEMSPGSAAMFGDLDPSEQGLSQESDWMSDDIALRIAFDAGRVTSRHIVRIGFRDEPLMVRVRRWLHL